MHLYLSRTGALWTSFQDWSKFQNCQFGYFTDKIKIPGDLNNITRLRLQNIQADVMSDLVTQCHSMEIQLFHSCVSSTRVEYIWNALCSSNSCFGFAHSCQPCDISKHLLPIIPCCTVPLWNWFYSRAPWHLVRQVLWWSLFLDAWQIHTDSSWANTSFY